jgi:hypothetical protein
LRHYAREAGAGSEAARSTAASAAATFAFMYSMINFDVSVGYISYGAIVAGAIDFLYGLIRFFDG